MNITKLAWSLWSDACFEWFSCEFSLKFHEPYLLRTITLITFQEQNKSLIIILQHQNWGLNIHSTPLSVGIKLCFSVVRRIIEAQFWHKVHPRPHSATSHQPPPASALLQEADGVIRLCPGHTNININIIAANYLPSHMAESWHRHLYFIISSRYVSVSDSSH